MKHVIIGTAGHVDHGKTLLVKALTGIDTDRLAEEKKRGITIELGFAHIDFPDGTHSGIVDVPGHEKFIKNMLAGAGGIDLAMLVVAADEGFMPQTVEHLGILTLLGIRDGLVVITKTDLVEPDWLEMVTEDVRDRVRDTFLEGKPILTVSAHTGEGIDALRQELHRMVLSAEEKNLHVPFRLPVDRVFSVDGFGTVVTGTLVEGCVHTEEIAELVPSGHRVKIRNLQVHGKAVSSAYAGERVAINLSDVKKADIPRGETVAQCGSMRIGRMLDVRLRHLKSSHRIIETQSVVHLYHGSGEVLAKIVLLDRDRLNPGESCLAQLRLTEEIATRVGDAFVIRFFSPLETIGGGTILDNEPGKHRSGDQAVLTALRIREQGSGADKLLQLLREYECAMPTASALASRLAVTEPELSVQMAELLGRGQVSELLPGRFIATSVIDAAAERCHRLLEDYHRAHPLQAGMRQAELRQKLFPRTEAAVAIALLEELQREGRTVPVADCCRNSEFEIVFTKRQMAIRDELLRIYQSGGLESPDTDALWPRFPDKERDNVRQVLESLVSGGDLVMLSPQIIVCRSVADSAMTELQNWFAEHETLTLAQYRDLLNTSRKYALAFLETYDKKHITRKDGDVRYPGSMYPVK